MSASMRNELPRILQSCGCPGGPASAQRTDSHCGSRSREPAAGTVILPAYILRIFSWVILCDLRSTTSNLKP